ncbi:MAG: hypothetical protein WA635_04570 [Gallionella sp.]
MIRSQFISFGIFLLGAILVTACTTTQLTSVWKDPAYQARPAKVMVIGLAKKADVRRLFEDEFVRQLKAHGTEAIASYTVIADNQQGDRAAIEAKVKELGTDSVLLTRLVKKETVKVYVPGTAYSPPPYYGTWPAYYGNAYSGGYVAEDEYAIIETNLYEVSNEKLVWTAASETLMGDSNLDLITTYIEVLVKAMSYNKLLGK